MEKAKPELAEGEMIENIEYENITSSDEEFSLPQLEARNPERENMNRISSAQGSEFGKLKSCTNKLVKYSKRYRLCSKSFRNLHSERRRFQRS